MAGSAVIETEIAAYSGVPLPIVLVAGQSNAEGRGVADDAPGEPGASTWKFDGGANTGKTINRWMPIENGTYFGPEWGASHDYNPLGVAKYALSGTNLHTQWQPTGTAYLSFIATVDEALLELTRCGKAYSVGSIIWLQGEADADTQAHAEAYAANLTATMAAIRARYGAGIKAIVVRIAQATGYANTVRAQQAAWVAGDGNAVYIDTSDLTTVDGVHFDTASMYTIGQRCAAEIP